MASQLKNDDVADVLIIGAGASGGVAAKHLGQAGFKVVCLEQGAHVDPDSYDGARSEWQLTARKRWHPNPNIRDLAEDYPVGVSDSDINPLMYNGVGGSTILYAGNWERLAPSDFRVRSLDGVADDWPISFQDLLPFYDAMDREAGVSGLVGDPAFPLGAPPPLPPLPLGAVGVKAAEGMDRLGWHWWPGPNSIPSRAIDGRNACVRRGTCLTGCPEGAKGSIDVTHWPHAIKSGVKLITGARVREILVDERNRAAGAVYFDRKGRERVQKASMVLMCANGVGTPRLLLLSQSGRNPSGLANSSGLVGKNLMMHPYAAVLGSFDEPLESWLGPAGQILHCLQFYETDLSRGFYRGAKWSLSPSGGPLGLRVGYADAPLEETWGVNFHRERARTFGRSFEWGIIAEDLPDENNQVALDPELIDSNGVPAPKVIYKTSENSRKLLDFHIERAKEAMLASGATSLSVTPLMRDAGWHLLGTARMGDDPATSVVNSFGRSHDVSNLFVLDGSNFVTSGGVNPTATICAIAMRAAKHIIASHRDEWSAS
ncbi:MAG: GMC family oxidoreductase [Beijerinckiaceae bacterium]